MLLDFETGQACVLLDCQLGQAMILLNCQFGPGLDLLDCQLDQALMCWIAVLLGCQLCLFFAGLRNLARPGFC